MFSDITYSEEQDLKTKAAKLMAEREAEFNKKVAEAEAYIAKRKSEKLQYQNFSLNKAAELLHSPELAKSRAKFLRQFYLALVDEGFTKEELEWKKGLRSERAEAFAEMACELSRKYDISRNKVIELVNEHFWDVWDTEAYIRGLVKGEYPLRETK